LNRKDYNKAVDDFSGRLFGYALKYLKNSEDASDIVQDVFERLWNNRKKVELEKAKSWLFTTAHNALVNFAQKKARLQYDSENLPEKIHQESNRFEMKNMVDKVLEILPPTQKSIVLLRDLEGYSYEEIGAMLQLSDSQVKVYLFRARKKIKVQLKDLTLLV
jgi:RNA polymerase sigma-70 factor (ECF subfamily)